MFQSWDNFTTSDVQEVGWLKRVLIRRWNEPPQIRLYCRWFYSSSVQSLLTLAGLGSNSLAFAFIVCSFNSIVFKKNIPSWIRRIFFLIVKFPAALQCFDLSSSSEKKKIQPRPNFWEPSQAKLVAPQPCDQQSMNLHITRSSGQSFFLRFSAPTL